jgi:hypothetical protein
MILQRSRSAQLASQWAPSDAMLHGICRSRHRYTIQYIGRHGERRTVAEISGAISVVCVHVKIPSTIRDAV